MLSIACWRLQDWLRLVSSSPAAATAATTPGAPGVPDSDKAAVAGFLSAVRAAGVLQDDGLMERYIRVWVDVAAAHALTNAQDGGLGCGPLQFMAVDALARLLVCLTVHGAGDAFLSRALTAVVGVIKREADERTVAFNGRPHLRLLIGIMCEIPGGGGSSPGGGAAQAAAAQVRFVRFCCCFCCCFWGSVSGRRLLQVAGFSVPSNQVQASSRMSSSTSNAGAFVC